MSFEIEQEYYVPPDVLFNTFTDAHTLTRLSRGSLAEALIILSHSSALPNFSACHLSDLRVGGKFSLFSGSIYGEYVEIEKPQKLVQKWKFRDWRDADYSQVSFEFIKVQENHTLLKLKHENIPLTNKFNEGL
ncbi:activator of Hsp90 ATPase, putative [Plasmodium malariae]|uniref:Activator of Hsp90 ATPase, putative n=1 Tax=Plasmodium malariae TaxID=5858 RepID=A0A1A8WKF2_PLAMA|nr:activator of Hsp90 ATPase, putative [Plasmodium malariae]